MKISSIVKNFSLIVINREASGWFAALILLLLLPSLPLHGQEGAQQPSKAAAEAAWNRGNYEVAYTHFNGLLLLYSRDPVYKYYTGACLTELQRDIPRAVELLGSAINSSVNIKSVPDEVWFYYGRALQMSGSFHDAADAYNRFSRAAGKRLAQEYKVQSYIDQCMRGEGALDVVRVTAGAVRKEESGVRKAESSEIRAQGTELSTTRTSEDKAESTSLHRRLVVPAGEAGREAVTGDRKEPGVEGRSLNDAPGVPEEYDSVLAGAVKLQHAADSLAALADAAESDLEKIAPQADDGMRRRAAESREKANAKQAEADALFLKLEGDTARPPQPAAEPTPTSSPAPAMTPAPTTDPPAHLFSLFEVRQKPAYSGANPIPIDISLPVGLVYTIQIAAFKNALNPSLFKGLYPVYGKLKRETGITFYYTGFFRRIEDARRALPKAREAGFPDAFVIALMNDIRVSMERASQLEKEWGAKPLPFEGETSAAEEKAGPEDTRPVGTLSFRAEVIRTDSPTPLMIEKIKLLAGQRGLDIIKNNEGDSVFLIGNFITFESAEDYVSLLIRNGYSTARVAAWVGMYEIPVEAARELLKRLPDD